MNLSNGCRWVRVHYMFFVCQNLNPKVQQRTYNIPQRSWKIESDLSCVWVGLSTCLQRDVFNQMLIHAALKSENKKHQKLGRYWTAGIWKQTEGFCFNVGLHMFMWKSAERFKALDFIMILESSGLQGCHPSRFTIVTTYSIHSVVCMFLFLSILYIIDQVSVSACLSECVHLLPASVKSLQMSSGGARYHEAKLSSDWSPDEESLSISWLNWFNTKKRRNKICISLYLETSNSSFAIM